MFLLNSLVEGTFRQRNKLLYYEVFALIGRGRESYTKQTPT
ncbi:hypothetical protein MPC4_250069 [Methylocella tundrae]|uniref:Uncharacterized protein n=1 Tax=Methylocella tundrae TaxID=227605 RepID=A0A8B6M7Y2_METTU|nr:hypothetical protein MPC1_1620005 [Methylocella tundrae]VTZ50561.1 hypothetical protein MPC4_250069 [Methylocella tundrae]